MLTELCTGESTEGGEKGVYKCVDSVDKWWGNRYGGEMAKRTCPEAVCIPEGGSVGRGTLS